MSLAVAFLCVSAAMFFTAGMAQEDKRNPRVAWIVFLVLATIFGIGASYGMNLIGNGYPCKPDSLNKQIYTVAGQVDVSGGTVVLLEDSNIVVYAVWSKNGETATSLPLGTKFAKIGKVADKICLVPVETPNASVTITNPLPIAGNQAESIEKPKSNADVKK